ncbi:hypothetical protein E2C01_039294 [Portunus trituberculatus]|uniref:Uncharacterized protein n=1 Tax=Portunus trituberculatus TaxID=210409 RepID=A0A5B7FD97_PORTR|nr:hypothetical protein [Portunus trituberculatus]
MNTHKVSGIPGSQRSGGEPCHGPRMSGYYFPNPCAQLLKVRLPPLSLWCELRRSETEVHRQGLTPLLDEQDYQSLSISALSFR